MTDEKGFTTGLVIGYKPHQEATIHIPKVVARVSVCGVCFTIRDDMKCEIPTKEQRENLKKVFGIDIEVLEDDNS